jgi:hypothetical protein
MYKFEIKQLTEIQLGYLCAMFDGEGHIGISRFYKRNYIYSPNISITNTFKPVLEHLKSFTKLGKIILVSEVDKRKDCYRWVLNKYDQLQLLSILVEYLPVKYKQAEIVTEYYETIKGSGFKTNIKTLALREILYEEIKELNKIGPKEVKDIEIRNRQYSKEFKIGYIAALLDGEGCISISKTKNIYSGCLKITNTNIILLKTVLNFTKIGSLKLKPNRNEKWAKCWDWTLDTKEQKKFLPTIIAYLVIKVWQAKYLLEFHELEKGANSSKKAPDKTIFMREVLFQELKDLNERGKKNV